MLAFTRGFLPPAPRVTDGPWYRPHGAGHGRTARRAPRARARGVRAPRWRALARLFVLGVGPSGTAARAGAVSPGAAGPLLARSGDAYVRAVPTADGVRWCFGTARVEKQVQLRRGHLALVSFRDRATGHELVQGPSDVLAFTWDGQLLTGRFTRWVLDGVQTRRLRQGELLVQLKLHTAGAAIVKSYLLYPRESIIQEWLTVTNRSGRPALLRDPASLEMHILQHEASALEFSHMAGPNQIWALHGVEDWTFHTDPLPDSLVLQGTMALEYAPIQVYQNRQTRNGVFIGWDYTGSWRSTIGKIGGAALHVDFQVASSLRVLDSATMPPRVGSYARWLRRGESVETPRVFTGVFQGDWDNMGHELLDWQYRYKWDYTRDPYFPGIAIEPSWAGSSWTNIWDPVTLYRQTFRMVDMLRAVGADIHWRDNGWWDNEGDWNGPNWGEARRYLARYGMRQIIYLPVFDASRQSRVAREHPTWPVYGNARFPDVGVLDQSRPAVIDWELKMMETKWRQWGDFEWRKDWFATTGLLPVPDTAGLTLAQDQGFRHLLRTFLDRHPGMAFHGCAAGGNDIGYEMLRFATAWQQSDGGPGVNRLRTYYESYIFPTDKLDQMLDRYSPAAYTKGWRGFLWNRFPMSGETEDTTALEGVRELIDLYHYLTRQGVVGRWGWVYHPRVTGDNPEGYLERLSRDHRRGAIIPQPGRRGPVTIYPKGLLPDIRYTISYQESPAVAVRAGVDLLAHGLRLDSVPDGEIIYLNLPLHPGSRADHTPPSPPTLVTARRGTHMDYTGVDLQWRPARDNNWVSYYEVYRNGALLGKAAKGTYYFDHTLGADPAARYTVVAVDGSGNRSPAGSATPAPGPPAQVIDDTSHALEYTGSGWEHRAVFNGTGSRTHTGGDAVTYRFEGNQVAWYGRLGAAMGIAAVYLDGHLAALVDTYDGDDIPHVTLYAQSFATVGRHTLTIRATGTHAQQASDSWIVVDGVQVDRTPVRVIDDAAGARLRYRGTGWQHTAAPEAAGGTVSWTSQPGDFAEATFEGTSVTWIGTRCPACGTADVYVDGRLETTVDTYAPPLPPESAPGERQPGGPAAEQWQVPLFSRSGLARGRHTLRIVARPDANLLATGRRLSLDALHVAPLDGRP